MSITSLSFTFVNTYASQAARPAASTERQAPVQETRQDAKQGARHCDEQRPATRQNRLVEAMMSALRELGFGSPVAAAPAAVPAATDVSATATPAQAAPAEAVSTNGQAAAGAAVANAAATDVAAATGAATTTDAAEAPAAATEAQPSAEPAVTIESAVHQFAHELFSALRAIGRGESSDQGANRIEGEDGRRHHHGHHGWRREGYGDMAQRLDALSQTFAAPAAVAAAGDAQSNALVSTSISITLTVQDGAADSSAGATSTAATPAPAIVAPEPAPAADASAAPAPAKSPLLEAFSKLFGALQPQAAGAPQVEMADKLRTFLQTLAQAMRPESMSGIQTPQVGGLVNVTA